MSEWASQAVELMSLERLLDLARALALLVAGFGIARLVRAALRRVMLSRLEPQQEQLLTRVAYYLIFGLFAVAALHELGFNLSVLLGAAGILTVAIGFASQTSASNFISGLFLIAERPFGVGDSIRIEGITGDVLSIDLLSIKVRTWDNLFVRIPNETVIKSVVTTFSRFPLRRVDLALGVAYKEDLRRVSEVLLEVAKKNPLGLVEPQPLIMVTGFGDSSINFQYSVWGQRQNYVKLKHSLQVDVHEAFAAAGIEIPFPQRTLRGSDADPLPVRLAGGEVGKREG